MFNQQHRYNTLDSYLKDKYQKKVFKVSLNGDFTCPNLDGSISKRGCIYCSKEGSGDFAGKRSDPLEVQFQTIRDIMHLKWKDAYYIAYFQANTNTYAPLSRLKELFEKAITLDKNIVILSIATRPDALSTEILDYLEELNTRIPVWIELGLQTINEESMKFLNLGYTKTDFEKSVSSLRKRGISVVAHIINGLPNETREMMIDTVRFLNNQYIQGIKIHSLFVLKDTILGRIYEKKPFELLSLAEYVKITSTQLSILNPNIVVHRINGDAPAKDLIAPLWTRKKFVVMNEIDKFMKENNLHQGINYIPR